MNLDDQLRSAYQRRLQSTQQSVDAQSQDAFTPNETNRSPQILAIAAAVLLLFVGIVTVSRLVINDDPVPVQLDVSSSPGETLPSDGKDPATKENGANLDTSAPTPVPTPTATAPPTPTATTVPADAAAVDAAARVEPTVASPEPVTSAIPNASASNAEPSPAPAQTPTVSAANESPGGEATTASPTSTPQPAAPLPPSPTVPPTATAEPTATAAPTPAPTATPAPSATATPTPTAAPSFAPGVPNTVCPSGARAELEFASLRYIGPNTGWNRLFDLVNEQDGPFYFGGWEPGYPNQVKVEIALSQPVLATEIRVAQHPFDEVSGSINFTAAGTSFSLPLSGLDGWQSYSFSPAIELDLFTVERADVNANIMEVLVCVEP